MEAPRVASAAQGGARKQMRWHGHAEKRNRGATTDERKKR
jgi:hypothetical protein